MGRQKLAHRECPSTRQFVSRVFSYFLKNFFCASPTYASFSPVFIMLFAARLTFPQLLVLCFPQHHNSGGRFSIEILGIQFSFQFNCLRAAILVFQESTS
jgi:hypothetical protein